MFRDVIRSSPFFGDVANEVFGNITGESFNGDISFVSSLRALLKPRIGDDPVEVAFHNSSYSADQLRGTSVSSALNAVSTTSVSNFIRIHNFNAYDESSNEAWMDFVKSRFCKEYEGWKELDKVSAFYRKVFNVACFVNFDTKSVNIFTCRMDTRKMHYLQCGILAFLPWYFKPEDGVTELEMELINSLREKTPDKYKEVLRKMAGAYDMRSTQIRKLLKGFETKYEQREITRSESEILRVNEEINNYNSYISDCLIKLRDLNAHLMGLQNKVAQASEESELMEYFLCNKNLTLISTDNDKIRFAVRQKLSIFDEEMAETMIENRNSILYRRSDVISSDDTELLLRAIFLDQSLSINFCAAYEFRIGGNINGIAGFCFGDEFSDCMPNTHIYAHACMGTYSQVINRLLKDNKYIEAIEQCAASCSSLNFSDAIVMREFIDYLISDSDSAYRCINLPDGRTVAVKEAVDYLNEKEGEKENG